MKQDIESLKKNVALLKSQISSLSARQQHLIELTLGQYYSTDNLDYNDFAYVFFHDVALIYVTKFSATSSGVILYVLAM